MSAESGRRLPGVSIDALPPGVLLPSQHFGARKPLAPEQRLMIAILQDAINCVEKYRFATDARGRRLFDEVTQWIGAKESGPTHSFEAICEVLDLDANAVRRRLDVAQEGPRHAKSTPSGRDFGAGTKEEAPQIRPETQP